MKSIAFKNVTWDFLRTTSECMDNAFRPFVEEDGLTMMQARILAEIMQCENSTVGSIGSKIGLSSGNASSMCKKLEKMGFIKRIRDPIDERFVNLVLTEIGVHTIKKIEDEIEKRYGTFFASKSEDEIQTVINEMRRVNSFIHEMNNLSNSK